MKILHNYQIQFIGEEIAGVETNVEFIKDLCRHPKFQAGDVHTGFIDENLDSLFPKLHPTSSILAQGVLGLILTEDLATLRASFDTKDPFNPFRTEIGRRFNYSLIKKFKLNFDDQKYVIDVKYTEPDVYHMRINDIGPWRRVEGILTQNDNDLELESEIDGAKAKNYSIKKK